MCTVKLVGEGRNSQGGDPALESFYTTEYCSHYTRPQTTAVTTRSVHPMASRRNTGFGSNNRVSPLDLAAREERTDYMTTSSHQAFAPSSSIEALRNPKPIARAAMEKSGYWSEPLPNVLYESPATRLRTAQERSTTAANLDRLTIQRMTKRNAVDGENGGAGPTWGSTTHGASYREHETNASKFWKVDKSLIGKREQDGFTRQHVMIPEQPVDDQTSTYTSTFHPPVRSRNVTFPDRVVMEKSGFTFSSIPTQTKNIRLSDVTANDLPSLTVHRMKHNSTTEHQNLYEPNPWRTTAQVSYKPPQRTTERAVTASCPIRHGATGYDSNETVRVGAPGDPRWAPTGKTEAMKKYKDPTMTLRTRGTTGACPNVMERSGYWAT